MGLAARLTEWNGRYEESHLPLEGPGNPGYLDEGVGLLHEVRAALHGRYLVLVTEPWWGEAPVEPPRG